MPAVPLTTRLRLVLALLLTVGLAACIPTRFPERPEEHRLYRELRQAPHPYYFLLERGVFSRVAGIQPESLMRALLSATQARWPDIDPLDSAEALIDYFRTAQLDPIAERIEETLALNAPEQPEVVDPRLEAGAIKQGLILVFYELRRED